ncbi:MAG TPA: hypothetical protein PLU30_25010 [Verrucomicrobiae bacterium]|nr:hypothetical protein [Verrucomicrobiae bacterium]
MRIAVPLCVAVLASLGVPLAAGAGQSNEGAEKVKQPVGARIAPKHDLKREDPVGNVVVRYSDGAEDTWTLKGNCMLPKVSSSGMVGWVVCDLAPDGKSLELHRGVPVGSRLTLCAKGKVIATLGAAKPFIEEWAFVPTGSGVVVKSRAAHGVAIIELFPLSGGAAQAAFEAFKPDLPDWARPFAD